MAVTINGTTGITTPSLTADTTTLVVDETNNRVGIGTASPVNELDVNGSIRISQDGGVIGNGDEKIKFDETGQTLQFQTADIERLRLSSSGNSITLYKDSINASKSDANILANLGNIALYIPAIGNDNVTGNMQNGIRMGDGNCGMIAYDNGSAGSNGIMFFTGNNTAVGERLLITGSGIQVKGSLSKDSGSFRIDHPLESKTDTHYLVHSFVEAPQADNIYRGKVDLVAGLATVNIDTVAGMTDGTFVALNREVQCFTSNESGWTAVKGSVSGNTLTIEAQDNTCTDTVSWLVVGERQDQHMYDTDWTDENGKVIVEPEKAVEEEETP